MEELEALNFSIRAASGEDGLALGVRGGAHHPDVEGVGGGGGRRGEDEEGKGEMVQIAMEGSIENLEGLGGFPSAHIVAGASEGAGEGVRARSEEVEVEVVQGIGAQVAHVVACLVSEGLAEDEASAWIEGAGGAGEQESPVRGGEFVEDVMEEDDVEFFGGGGKFFEWCGVGAEGGFGPAGGAEIGEEVVQAPEGGARVVAGGKSDGAFSAEVVEKCPSGGACAATEVEDA